MVMCGLQEIQGLPLSSILVCVPKCRDNRSAP
jgi:hypothetical protein